MSGQRVVLPRAAAILSLGLLLVAGGPTAIRPVAAQEEEDLTAGLKVIRAAYDRARDRIDDLDFAGAVRELGGLLDPRRAVKPSDLSLEEKKLICAAYDLRARAYFNLGNIKGAESDFEALLRLDSYYAIDRQTLSPKVVDLFDRVRARVVAELVLQIDPSKARVALDGTPVSPSDLARIPLLVGSHELRAEMDGFEPWVETVNVKGGGEIRKTIRLRPNRRSLEFITIPAGTTVAIDGTATGVSRGPATPDVEALAQQYSFNPKDASAPLLVPLVTPGDHKVTFEHDCYQAQALNLKVTIDPEKNVPLRFAPVHLQDARADLKITSTPSGADVLIDGEKKGATPLTIPGVCGGERDVVVARPEVGTWTERIRITAGQTNTLDVRLRPTLVYVGTFRLDDWGRAVWSDEDKPLLEELSRGLRTLNQVRAPEVLAEVRASIIKWMIGQPGEVRAGTLLPPALLQEVAAKTHADLVLAGLTLENDPGKVWTLALYSVLHPAPDVVTLRTDRPESAREFVGRLDSAPATAGIWWGMGLADTSLDDGEGGPIVVRVLPGSPGAKGGLKAGDRVRSVGERRVKEVRDLTQALTAETARPGGLRAPIVLAVQGAGPPRTVRISPGESPVVIPLSDPSLLYNRALAEFRLISRASVEESERGVALLNLGVTFMHFRAYDKAQSEGFAKASLPPGTGLSAGTVLYYRGLCALRRGDPGAARAAFEGAVSAPGSTFDSGDGPSAAAAAARMLRVLQ